jgi:hypothetical protein
MFKKRGRLPPLPQGLGDYWVTVHVELHERLLPEDPWDQSIVGYYCNFGVRCASHRVRDLLIDAIDDGVVDWAETTIVEVDPGSLEEEIRSRICLMADEGIWYKSGRAFYPDEAAEAPVN